MLLNHNFFTIHNVDTLLHLLHAAALQVVDDIGILICEFRILYVGCLAILSILLIAYDAEADVAHGRCIHRRSGRLRCAL